ATRPRPTTAPKFAPAPATSPATREPPWSRAWVGVEGEVRDQVVHPLLRLLLLLLKVHDARSQRLQLVFLLVELGDVARGQLFGLRRRGQRLEVVADARLIAGHGVALLL